MKLYKYILKHYGEIEDQELAEIFGDLHRNIVEGTGDAKKIGHRFAKWEKERGL